MTSSKRPTTASDETYLTDASTRWAVWGSAGDDPERCEDRGRCVMLLHAEPCANLLPEHWVRLYCVTGTYNQAMQKYYDVEEFGTYRPIDA
jgi:hypothetical protein